ncbi:hypothetical protein [Salimicrobium halophilum]|uniref:Uncharacterized protein n=1 Tax=Salimicrobium halophilum TaxID=86666 RepID=A0A1G8R1Z2_9BACI|nr:hypothetical protein [Salimicrobium halophilum]SDJ10863.1 hypothetical protein SAMN04490247_0765 [Salimicrobium halophilum]
MYKITFEDHGIRKVLTSSGSTETKVFQTYVEAKLMMTNLEKHAMYDKQWAIEPLESEQSLINR